MPHSSTGVSKTNCTPYHADCDGEWVGCGDCHGEGEVVTCIDDCCRGSGECFHGDGYGTCRHCGGTGEVFSHAEPAP